MFRDISMSSSRTRAMSTNKDKMLCAIYAMLNSKAYICLQLYQTRYQNLKNTNIFSKTPTIFSPHLSRVVNIGSRSMKNTCIIIVQVQSYYYHSNADIVNCAAIIIFVM